MFEAFDQSARIVQGPNSIFPGTVRVTASGNAHRQSSTEANTISRCLADQIVRQIGLPASGMSGQKAIEGFQMHEYQAVERAGAMAYGVSPHVHAQTDRQHSKRGSIQND